MMFILFIPKQSLDVNHGDTELEILKKGCMDVIISAHDISTHYAVVYTTYPWQISEIPVNTFQVEMN